MKISPIFHKIVIIETKGQQTRFWDLERYEFEPFLAAGNGNNISDERTLPEQFSRNGDREGRRGHSVWGSAAGPEERRDSGRQMTGVWTEEAVKCAG